MKKSTGSVDPNEQSSSKQSPVEAIYLLQCCHHPEYLGDFFFWNSPQDDTAHKKTGFLAWNRHTLVRQVMLLLQATLHPPFSL